MQHDTLRPLAGRSGWIITDGKTGMETQARGVAEALGLKYVMKRVEPRGLWKLVAPWGPVAPGERPGRIGSQFLPPWPAVVIATGRVSIPYIRAIRHAAGPGTFTVVLQDPRTGPNTADLICVPQHDRRRGVNVMTMLTAPHGFSASRLTALRAAPPPAIAALGHPRVAVLLGGKNSVYKFTNADYDRLEAALRSLAALGASFMITPSRRTHAQLSECVDRATRDARRVLWTGEGANPYADFLANADALVVTADSVSMTGEACATGKPVYVFHPSRGSAKFRRFHAALEQHGATRPLPETLDRLPSWSYKPLDSTAAIAAEIERRWLRRASMMSGLVSR